MFFENIFVIQYNKLDKVSNLEGRKIEKKLSLKLNFFLENSISHMHPNVHRSTVYNSQDMEAT